MFERKSIIASAILVGLTSGIALAHEETSPPVADHGGGKMEKKIEGKKKSAKKVEKNGCGGPNGCGGMSKETKPAGDEKKAQ